MATANSFLKITPVVLEMGTSHGTYINGTTPLPVDSSTIVARKFAYRVEDLTTLSVYYNGQLIQSDVEPITATDAKFYYVITNALGTIDPITGVDSGSFLVLEIKENPSYRGVGYASGAANLSFLSTDTIVVSYYYVIYSA